MFLFAKNCCCFCLLVRSAAVCSNTPLNITGICHMRDVTCKQWKLYFFSVCSRFCQLFPPFHVCEMWRDNLDACNLQLQVSDVWTEETTQYCVFFLWHCNHRTFWAFLNKTEHKCFVFENQPLKNCSSYLTHSTVNLWWKAKLRIWLQNSLDWLTDSEQYSTMAESEGTLD